MLRILVLAGIAVGVGGAASAEPLQIQSATLTQTNVHNYALVAPGGVSTEITVNQSGADNNVVVDQSGDINAAEVNQRATHDNNSSISQFGAINIAAVTQQYNFGAVLGATPGHTGAADKRRLPVRIQQRRRQHSRADRARQHADQQLRQGALNFEAIKREAGRAMRGAKALEGQSGRSARWRRRRLSQRTRQRLASFAGRVEGCEQGARVRRLRTGFFKLGDTGFCAKAGYDVMGFAAKDFARHDIGLVGQRLPSNAYLAGVPILYYYDKSFSKQTDAPYPGVDAQVNFVAMRQTDYGALIAYVNVRAAGQLQKERRRRSELPLQQRRQRLHRRRPDRSGMGPLRRIRSRHSAVDVRFRSLGLLDLARLFVAGEHAGRLVHLPRRQHRRVE